MKPATNLGNNQPPVASNIPEALREALHWLLWKDLPPLKPGGKRRKVPYYVTGIRRHGTLDSPADIARLTSCEDACTALTQSQGYAGLGFALGRGWQGCDLDGCRDPVTGKLEAWAIAIIERAATYAEISPSGKGVHLLGYDMDEPALKALGANGSGVEFYAAGRFFTFTGRVLEGFTAPVRSLAPVYGLAERRWLDAGEVAVRRQTQGLLPSTGGSIEWPGFALELSAKLHHVPPGRPRERWLAISMGIHHASGGSEAGFRFWHDWSAKATDGSYTGEADLRKQWAGFDARHAKPVTWGTVKMYLDEFSPKVAPPPQMDGDALPFADITVEPVERRAFIDGWLYDRVVLLQAADGGSGKSYMGLLEAMMVAGGYSCGMGWKVEPGKVLFYTGEDDADVLRWRMRRYCNFYGWRLETFRERLAIVDRSETDCTLYTEGRNGTGEFTAEYARLVRTVARFDPAYVVIDNASHVFNGNENNRATVRHFLSGLTALKRAVNLLAHVNKVTAGGNANQAVAYSGSTAWNNTVRARRAQAFEEGRGTITIAKSNYGPTGTTLTYQWDDQAKLFIPGAVVNRAHARDHGERLLSIIQKLEERPASLSARAPNHIGKLILAHPDCPRGIELRALKRWLDQQVALGRIEECEVKRGSRHKAKGVRVTSAR